MKKVVYDLCGGTGSWSEPYKRAGYDVRLIDVVTEGTDCRLLEKPDEDVFLVLCAPPCTIFANSGNRWKRTPEEIRDALSVVDACLRFVQVTKPKYWAMENPVGKLKRYLGEPRMYFNPSDFGDPYTKRTLLWGDFNIPKFTPVPPTEGSKMHFVGPGKQRQRIRSITPEAFAKAFFERNR